MRDLEQGRRGSKIRGGGEKTSTRNISQVNLGLWQESQ